MSLDQVTWAEHRQAAGCRPGILCDHCGGPLGQGCKKCKGRPWGPGTAHISAAEGRLAEGGLLRGTLEGSGVQSAAVADLASNSHGSSQERLVAGAQRGEPNFYWLLSGWRGGSRELQGGRRAGWRFWPRGRGG